MSDIIADFISKKRGKVDEYREKIEAMLNNQADFDWAEETLTGIYDYILERDSITEKQMTAVDNIETSVENYANHPDPRFDN